MKRLLNWLAGKFSADQAAPQPDLRQTGAHLYQTGSQAPPQARPRNPARPRRDDPKPAESGSQPEFVELDTRVRGRIEDSGPGKNVLIRNKYVREDTGTHETLKILDDSLVDTDEETGADPYNTGHFDRSKNWDKRFR